MTAYFLMLCSRDVTDLALELSLQHLFLIVKLFHIQPASVLQPLQLHLQGQLLLGRLGQI